MNEEIEIMELSSPDWAVVTTTLFTPLGFLMCTFWFFHPTFLIDYKKGLILGLLGKIDPALVPFIATLFALIFLLAFLRALGEGISRKGPFVLHPDGMSYVWFNRERHLTWDQIEKLSLKAGLKLKLADKQKNFRRALLYQTTGWSGFPNVPFAAVSKQKNEIRRFIRKHAPTRLHTI